MTVTDMRSSGDMDPFNYFALAILEHQGNRCPSEEEICVIESKLGQNYLNRDNLLDAMQSLNICELSQRILGLPQ